MFCFFLTRQVFVVGWTTVAPHICLHQLLATDLGASALTLACIQNTRTARFQFFSLAAVGRVNPSVTSHLAVAVIQVTLLIKILTLLCFEKQLVLTINTMVLNHYDVQLLWHMNNSLEIQNDRLKYRVEKKRADFSTSGERKSWILWFGDARNHVRNEIKQRVRHSQEGLLLWRELTCHAGHISSVIRQYTRQLLLSLLQACLFVCLSVCLSVCLFVCLFVYFSSCDSRRLRGRSGRRGCWRPGPQNSNFSVVSGFILLLGQMLLLLFVFSTYRANDWFAASVSSYWLVRGLMTRSNFLKFWIFLTHCLMAYSIVGLVCFQ